MKRANVPPQGFKEICRPRLAAYIPVIGDFFGGTTRYECRYCHQKFGPVYTTERITTDSTRHIQGYDGGYDVTDQSTFSARVAHPPSDHCCSQYRDKVQRIERIQQEAARSRQQDPTYQAQQERERRVQQRTEEVQAELEQRLIDEEAKRRARKNLGLE
ncbi:cell envelope integrity protein TolA [Candidatus Woesearchaeota archaeon]|nr:cell envelope integrity protein TolA [Candidatus Woesearchaeota archaeon]HIH37381.1 cell envelope integrity protein TolA [Candidatus Woesearchaeota archaeon]HIH48398.1 cell envelope integrity protein TolA [Candidatus Woesearchaeota archaeon]HIJ04221.1 cell envelope integrity protein TolA [Candidatus Woesearchaeota archaeon]